MQFFMETVPSDIALMFITYLGFCLLLMYLFIRADCEWNKREIKMSHERLLKTSEKDNGDRLRDLTVCSEYHDIGCSCFLKSGDKEGSGEDGQR